MILLDSTYDSGKNEISFVKIEARILDLRLHKCFGSRFFSDLHSCSFFMGIILCSGVDVSWTFNTRSVYNFITEKANFLVNFAPILLLLKVWSNKWAKIYFFHKEQKSQGYLFKTGQNSAVGKMLVWSAYIWRMEKHYNYIFLE